MELNKRLYEQVKIYCAEGNELLENDSIKAAIKNFEKAYDLLPAPKNQWEANTWINATIGDCYFLLEQFDKSLEYFIEAYNSPGGIDNPFTLIRVGENHFELSNYEPAKEYLMRAHMLEGYEIFA